MEEKEENGNKHNYCSNDVITLHGHFEKSWRI